MDDETRTRILAHTQAVSRHYLVLKTTLDFIVESITYSMGEHAPDKHVLEAFLRKAETQRTLEADWEVGLWRGIDKVFRLICLATTVDPGIARRRLARFPASPGSQCAFCLLDERGLAHLELRPELDAARNQVPARMLHPACIRPWGQLRALIERVESKP